MICFSRLSCPKFSSCYWTDITFLATVRHEYLASLCTTFGIYELSCPVFLLYWTIIHGVDIELITTLHIKVCISVWWKTYPILLKSRPEYLIVWLSVIWFISDLLVSQSSLVRWCFGSSSSLTGENWLLWYNAVCAPLFSKLLWWN